MHPDHLEMINSAPIGIAIIRDGKFRFVNHEYLQMFGYRYPNELIEKSLMKVQPKTLMRKRLRSILREQGIEQIETYDSMGLKKDNSLFPIHVHAKRVIFENEPSTMAYIQDLSNLISVSQSYIQFEENLRQFLISSPIPFSVTEDRKIMDANSAFLELFGYQNLDQIIGLDTRVIQAKEARGDIDIRIKNREKGDFTIDTYESIGLRMDGSTFPMRVTATRTEFDERLVIVVFIEPLD